MIPVSRFVITVAMACLPLLARAEGKCDDDPFLLRDRKTLAVTWTIPVLPGDDPTIDTRATLMTDLDARSPIEPPGFPPEYASNLWKYPYPDHPESKKKITNKATHAAWLSQFGLAEGPVAAGITDKYFADGRMLFGVVVQHPPLPSDKSGYQFCTCILQRAVLLWDDLTGKEHLWIRTRFHSAKDKLNWTNFEPSHPVKFAFLSPSLWFPLAYNHVLPESPSFLVLDAVTRKKLGAVAGFTSEDLGQVTYQIGARPENWYVARLRARFEKGTSPADLSIAPP